MQDDENADCVHPPSKRENRLKMRRDGLDLPKKFGEVITADHKVLSEDNQSIS